MSIFRRAAIAYLALVMSLALWAVYAEAVALHAPREHLLPGMMLSMAALPSSLSLGPLYQAWSSLLDNPFAQVGWLLLCGLFQGTLLLLASRRRQSRAEA